MAVSSKSITELNPWALSSVEQEHEALNRMRKYFFKQCRGETRFEECVFDLKRWDTSWWLPCSSLQLHLQSSCSGFSCEVLFPCAALQNVFKVEFFCSITGSPYRCSAAVRKSQSAPSLPPLPSVSLQISLGDALITAGAQLVELDLSDNAFGPDGVRGFEALLKSPACYTLQELKLNNCGMGIGGGKVRAVFLLGMRSEQGLGCRLVYTESRNGWGWKGSLVIV